MEDIWKSIKDYEGMYEMTETGKFRSIDRIVIGGKAMTERRIKGKILSININSVGYPCVNLYKNNKGYAWPIHILIGINFIPNPDNHRYILHKNDIKTDFSINNLYWGTNSNNYADSVKNGNRINGENHHKAKLTNEIVKEIKQLLDGGVEGKSIARDFNISENIVSSIKTGKTWNQI